MVFGYNSQFWEDGGVGSTGNLSPHLHNNCTSRIYLMELFGTLDFVEGLQLPREELDSNLWLILVNFSHQHNSSFPSPHHVAGCYTLVPGAAYTEQVLVRIQRNWTLCEVLVGIKVVQSLQKIAWQFLKKTKNLKKTCHIIQQFHIRYTSRRIESRVLKIYLQAHVHNNIIHNS